MIHLLVISFIIGLFSKFVDLVEEHGLKAPKFSSTLAGMLYGALIGYVVSTSYELSSIAIAVFIGVLLTGKIDTKGQYLGLASMIIFLLIFGISGFNLYYLIIFVFFGMFDEVFNNRVVDKRKIKNKIVSDFFEFRPFLEVAVFFISFVTGIWIIWLGMISYDIGYNLISKIGARFI